LFIHYFSGRGQVHIEAEKVEDESNKRFEWILSRIVLTFPSTQESFVFDFHTRQFLQTGSFIKPISQFQTSDQWSTLKLRLANTTFFNSDKPFYKDWKVYGYTFILLSTIFGIRHFTKLMKRTYLFRLIKPKLSNNPQLTNLIGTPLTINEKFSGKLFERSAELKINVKGPNGDVVVTVTGIKDHEDDWQVTSKIRFDFLFYFYFLSYSYN
jgi:hypothetical protein